LSEPLRWLLLALAIAAWGAPAVSAQTLEIDGGEEDRAAALARQIIARGAYQVISRDTVLPAETRVRGDLVVVEARVALEGTVEGAVVVVLGDFFVRPRAHVAGPVVVLGGDAYISGLAIAGEVVRLDPRITPELERTPQLLALTLLDPPDPGPFRVPGMLGFGLPTYDRVNGISIPWSGQLGLTGGDTAVIALHGTGVLRLARRQLDGSAELRFRPAFRSVAGARVGRTTRTNEQWIRGDLANSLSALFVGSDVRDYFASDELAVFAARTPPASLVTGEGYIVPAFQLALSRDRSLPARQVWSLFGGGTGWRPNPPIDEGTLASLSASAAGEWRGPTARFSGGAGLEWAPGIVGDFEFAQLTAGGHWSMQALLDHRIRLHGFTRVPLGSAAAPRQRWSFVGGPGTLPTFATGELRGDHVVFLRSIYTAPIPLLQLPLIGSPTLRLEHAIGTAWATGEPRPPLEQNAAAGLEFFLFHALLYVDPARRPLRPTLSLGIDLPGRPPLPTF
jgi:hypothetical protein